MIKHPETNCQRCGHAFEQWEERYTTMKDGRVITICWECAEKPHAVFHEPQGDTRLKSSAGVIGQISEETRTAIKTEGETGHVLLSSALPPLPPAEENELHTKQLMQATQKNFLMIGKLLAENRDNKYWALHHTSWHDYIESLGLAQRNAYLMIESWELQSVANITESEILEIGIAKTQLLLPLARQGKLTTDIIELAKVSPVRDLKEELGHKIKAKSEEVIHCPHCGGEIKGAKWV